MRKTIMTVAALSVLALATACDSKGSDSTTPPEDAAGPDDGSAATQDASAADVAWPEMSMDQKKGHMMAVVVPKMGEVFKAVDAERHADFGCVTCHGEGAKEGQFEMPSPSLPKLPANGDFAALQEAKPDVVNFMMGTVVPEMAGALGVPAYNPETHEGFGCYGCHQSE